MPCSGCSALHGVNPNFKKISKVFDRVWHVGHLHKLKSYGISGQIVGLISFFLSNRQLWEVLDGKSSQEYPVNSEVAQGTILKAPILVLHFSYDTLMTFLKMLFVIFVSLLVILLSTLSVTRRLICGNN